MIALALMFTAILARVVQSLFTDARKNLRGYSHLRMSTGGGTGAL